MTNRTTRWRTSSKSGSANECVELDRGAERTAIRDSKAPGAGLLAFGDQPFQAFLHTVRAAVANR
ncbi:DUF397 domain-containing protein [Actinokineospora sp.]|uniref:DUF397 domain-containing protein n=1 Tax=Actinokineospora sp. TaxID=1872133 RepID=UPI00403815F5